MRKFHVLSLIILSALFSIFTERALSADTPNLVQCKKSTLSPIEFYVSNNGIFGENPKDITGGFFWPRGSQNQYLFGSGLWVGAQKKVLVSNAETIVKLVEVTFNPSDAKSMFVPGLIGDTSLATKSDTNLYKLYFSTDFNQNDGSPKNSSNVYNWPFWITDKSTQSHLDEYKDEYVVSANNRSASIYPLGASFVSDEEIASVMKDDDLSIFQHGIDTSKTMGYPLGLEITQKVYSWNATSDLKNSVIVTYFIKNKSIDTLMDMYIGENMDFDILNTSNPNGYSNDYCRYLSEEPNLNTVINWTGTTQGEKDKGFGYVGVSLIESPVVNPSSHYISNGKVFDSTEQLGLRTLKAYSIENDPKNDSDKYALLSADINQSKVGPRDIRLIMSTGPLNLRPNDVAKFSIAYTFALPAKGGEATGAYEDIAGVIKGKIDGVGNEILATPNSLLSNILKLRSVYYNAIKTDVSEVTKRENFSIYPNPAQDFIYINSEKIGNFNYKVYSISGAVCLEGIATSEKIDISNLNCGVYILEANKQKFRFIKY